MQWPSTTHGTAGTAESNSLGGKKNKKKIIKKKASAAGITDQCAEETGKEQAGTHCCKK